MPIDPKTVGPPAGLVADADLTTSAVIAFTEGPAVDARGNVFFSDIQNNRIMMRAADGTLSVWRADSGRANGNMFDAEGRLVTCEGAEFGPGGRRRMTRTDMTTGAVELLTDRFEGRRYNSPNDLVIDDAGRIYFTDPRYGDQSGREMDVEAVYRIERDGAVTRILQQPDIQKPNGITLSPDNRTLYLVDSNPTPGGNRKIWAFEVAADGTVGGRRLVYDFGRGRGGDGMRIDADGNLWIAAGVHRARNPNETTDVPTGIYVVTPRGELLGRIPVPEDAITNMAFGGPDLKTLYIVAGKTLFSIRVNVAGHVVYPKPRGEIRRPVESDPQHNGGFMQRVWVWMLAAAIVFAWTGTACAGESKTGKPAREGEAKSDEGTGGKAEEGEKAPKKIRPLHGTGNLVKVDGARITVRLRNKGTFTLGTDSGTLVMKGHDYLPFADLKTGQRIRVIYEDREGGMIATEVHILPPESAARPKKEGKKEGKGAKTGEPATE